MTQMPYREDERGLDPEPTRTVSDWHAFWVGFRGVGQRGLFLLFLLVVSCPLFFSLLMLDGLRYLVFLMVAEGHRQMGIANTRAFTSYAEHVLGKPIDKVFQKAAFKDGFSFGILFAFGSSSTLWSAFFGSAIEASWTGHLVFGFGGFTGALIGLLAALVTMAWIGGMEKSK